MSTTIQTVTETIETTDTDAHILAIDPSKPSIFALAHRNPDVPAEIATLEDYNILSRNIDNLKYLFVRPAEQPSTEEIKYEIKQIILGANIYNPGLLGEFISEYLNNGDVSENGDVVADVTSDITKLTSDYYVDENYDTMLTMKEDLLEKQARYHDGIISNGQDAIVPIEVDIIDIILLIAEFTQRVIMPEVLQDPDRLGELQSFLRQMNSPTVIEGDVTNE